VCDDQRGPAAQLDVQNPLVPRGALEALAVEEEARQQRAVADAAEEDLARAAELLDDLRRRAERAADQHQCGRGTGAGAAHVHRDALAHQPEQLGEGLVEIHATTVDA
jgi:uncharacterized membrane protein